MFKVPIATKDDINEAAKLERRLQFEDERKTRIFNAKQRLFGVCFPWFFIFHFSLFLFFVLLVGFGRIGTTNCREK